MTKQLPKSHNYEQIPTILCFRNDGKLFRGDIAMDKPSISPKLSVPVLYCTLGCTTHGFWSVERGVVLLCQKAGQGLDGTWAQLQVTSSNSVSLAIMRFLSSLVVASRDTQIHTI